MKVGDRRRLRPGRGSDTSGRLELVWPGKYGPDGQRTEPARTVESLVELERFPDRGGATPNLLVAGDNLGILPALLAEAGASAALVYADPPFLTGDEFRTTRRRTGSAAADGAERDGAEHDRGEAGPGDAGRREAARHGAGDGELAYRDRRPDGLGGFAAMLAPRLTLLRELLRPGGALYLHLDARTVHVAKLICDDVFGPAAFRNHLVWVYGGRELARRRYNAKHDDILFYANGPGHTFHPERILEPLLDSSRRAMSRHVDDDGRAYVIRYRRGGGFAARDEPGRTYRQHVPDGTLPRDWFAVDYARKAERTGYPTQKPVALVERILLASTDPGDLIVDPFVGSGTTAVAAAGLGRRWMAADASPVAIATTRRRLLKVSGTPAPFRIAALPGSVPPAGHLAISAAGRDRDDGRLDVDLTGPDLGRVDAWAVGTLERRDGAADVFVSRASTARAPWTGRVDLAIPIDRAAATAGSMVRAWDETGAATTVPLEPLST